MATWKKPNLQRKDRWKQQVANITKTSREVENREKYLTTWTSPSGETNRQIDYITIIAKQRNIVRKAPSNIYWRGDMDQNQQRRVQTMQLYYSAAKKYKKPIPTETGEKLRYDVKELREHPERLTSAFHEYEGKNPTQEQQNQDWAEWEIYQKH